MTHADTNNNGWPPRPADECFPQIMDCTDVALLLRLDNVCNNVELGRRTVRRYVKQFGLPMAGKIGRELRFSKEAVMAWLQAGGTKGAATEGRNAAS